MNWQNIKIVHCDYCGHKFKANMDNSVNKMCYFCVDKICHMEIKEIQTLYKDLIAKGDKKRAKMLKPFGVKK